MPAVTDETSTKLIVPKNIAELYNSDLIGWEETCERSAVQYHTELSMAEQQLNDAKEDLKVHKELVMAKNREISEVKAELEEQTTLKLALANARRELTEAKPRLAELGSIEALNVDLTRELKEANNKIEQLVKESASLVAVSHELDSEKEANASCKAKIDSLNAEIESLNQKLRVANESVKNLTKRVDIAEKTAGGTNRKLEKDNETLLGKLAAAKSSNESKDMLLKEMGEKTKEAFAAIDGVSTEINQVLRDMETVDKKNRLLSLYVNARSTVPILATPQGELRVCMIDAHKIVNSDGKETLAEDSALFYWFAPCGFGCMVALSDDKSKGDDLIVMPQLEHRLRGQDATLTAAIEEMQAAMTPPKALFKEIAEHIKKFSPSEFKRAMTAAFMRAQAIESKLGVEDKVVASSVRSIKDVHKQMQFLEQPIKSLMKRGKQARRPKSSK